MKKIALTVFGIWLIFPLVAFAQPDLPDLPADTALEDPNSSSFTSSDIFFDNTSLDTTTSSDTATTTVIDTSADTTSSDTGTATTATPVADTTATVADSATGANTATVFWLAATLATLTLFLIKQKFYLKIKSE